MPEVPPGIVSVTRVSCMYPVAGMNITEVPRIRQCPGMAGDSCGIGERAATGAENRSWTGAVPLTPWAPAAGVTDTSRSAAAAGRGVDAAWLTAETGAAWPFGEA